MNGIMREIIEASLAPGHETNCKQKSQYVGLVDVDLPCHQDDSPVLRNRTALLVSTNMHSQCGR